ncbi:MAG: hybrid sensor histidine kinase/response regulator, partial [Gammaproteobacteria bacterium]|nr:hybrid sensor histidine kinase/response regulator [Gammaproteobacteria bacterium]
RVEVRGHDELASLASHLNRMTVSLESAITDLRSEIDARKVAEARLLEAHHELERRVQQRTRALNRAKDDAENASKAKSQFLSRMSHELRTPLNAILGFGQMLNRDPEGDLSDKKRGFVDRILSSGDHLLNMINEVLDLSRIESEALSIEIQTVSPRVLLDECLEQITAAYVDR